MPLKRYRYEEVSFIQRRATAGEMKTTRATQPSVLSADTTERSCACVAGRLHPGVAAPQKYTRVQDLSLCAIRSAASGERWFNARNDDPS